jgi:hypothetical protein
MKSFVAPSHFWKRVLKSQLHPSKQYSTRSRSRKHTNPTGKAAGARGRISTKMDTDYSAWSNEKLIERVTQLEAALKKNNERFPVLHPTSMRIF